jgi:hypothetical protein
VRREVRRGALSLQYDRTSPGARLRVRKGRFRTGRGFLEVGWLVAVAFALAVGFIQWFQTAIEFRSRWRTGSRSAGSGLRV